MNRYYRIGGIEFRACGPIPIPNSPNYEWIYTCERGKDKAYALKLLGIGRSPNRLERKEMFNKIRVGLDK